jgi:hypothetical protein
MATADPAKKGAMRAATLILREGAARVPSDLDDRKCPLWRTSDQELADSDSVGCPLERAMPRSSLGGKALHGLELHLVIDTARFDDECLRKH